MNRTFNIPAPGPTLRSSHRPAGAAVIAAVIALAATLGFGVRAWTESTDGLGRTSVERTPAVSRSFTIQPGVPLRERPGDEPSRGFGKPL